VVVILKHKPTGEITYLVALVDFATAIESMLIDVCAGIITSRLSAVY
jgi:hypothetical protein